MIPPRTLTLPPYPLSITPSSPVIPPFNRTRPLIVPSSLMTPYSTDSPLLDTVYPSSALPLHSLRPLFCLTAEKAVRPDPCQNSLNSLAITMYCIMLLLRTYPDTAPVTLIPLPGLVARDMRNASTHTLTLKVPSLRTKTYIQTCLSPRYG